MSRYVKAGGVWRAAKPYVKVGGIWKFPDYIYNKVAGRWYTSFVKGGLVDRSWDDRDETGEFGIGPDVNSTVVTIAFQSDGKILFGGNFFTWNGTAVGNVIRLNSDRTIDTAFSTNVGTGTSGGNDTVYNIAIQSDGKIVVSGFFTSWNGTSVGNILRLNSDGTRDTSFTTNTGTGANSIIQSMAIQSDGKIVVVGSFTTWNGTSVGRIVRLNSDGTRDTSFSTNVGTGASDNAPFAISFQSDGKILISGGFTVWNGTTVGNIVRLNSDGTRDTSFSTNVGTGASTGGGYIQRSAVQSDGKIVLSGPFTNWNGTTVGNIVRLNSDGTRDTSFSTNVGTGANGSTGAIAIQSDGKILINGSFTTWNGTTVGKIVRLNSDGTRETAFTTNIGTAAEVNSIAIQSDGKILIGGSFNTWNGITVRKIIRLNSDGSYTSLNAFANNEVKTIAVQSDGKVLIGGIFTTWNGVTVGGIVRLNLNGTRDTDFSTNVGTGASNIGRIAIQSDGKIIIVGSFTIWNGTTVGVIVRLNSDGTRDTSFSTNTGTGANNTTSAIAFQPDGKILIGGGFTTWNGVTVNRIVRLNSDGTRDTAFTTNTGTGASGSVNRIAIQSDGKIVLCGSFSTWNGVTARRIVRLNSDGTIDTAFTTNISTGPNFIIESLGLQSDGKIVLGGSFWEWNGITVNYIVRLNSDGTRDTVFTANTGTGAGAGITDIAIQSDGKILLSGGITSWNGVLVGGGAIVRLNSDGTRDTAFTTNVGTSSDSVINTIAIQVDGKILLGGTFNAFKDLGKYRRYFVRIGGEDAS